MGDLLSPSVGDNGLGISRLTIAKGQVVDIKTLISEVFLNELGSRPVKWLLELDLRGVRYAVSRLEISKISYVIHERDQIEGDMLAALEFLV